MAKNNRPAFSTEARENQLISLAVNLAEKQLQEGTASSQVITHYLKLATVKEKLKLEQMKEENKLLRAKTKAIEEQKDFRKICEDAILAMKEYSGDGV